MCVVHVSMLLLKNLWLRLILLKLRNQIEKRKETGRMIYLYINIANGCGMKAITHFVLIINVDKPLYVK